MKSNLKKLFALLFAIIMLMNLSACKIENSETGKGSEESTIGEKVDMKAAMCKVDITPHRNVLTAYSEGPESLAKYPDDFLTSLMARILILEVNGERLLHVNMEFPYAGFGTITSIGFKKKLANAAGAEATNVFIGHTHNHQSNPMMDEDQEAAVIDAVKKAAENLVPVKWGIETYGTEYGISRSPAFGQNYDAPYDNTVTVIRFDNAETNAPVGMIYCAPVHNTAFGNGRPENWSFVNCEFTGFTSRHIEETFAEYPDFTAIHFLGFTGNAGPYFPDADRFYAQDIEELELFGGQFGDEILECYKSIVCEEAYDIAIHVYKETYSIQRAKLTDEIKQYWGDDTTVEALLNAFSLGDIAYMEMNGEPFSTIGAHLRAECPFEYLVAITNVDHGGWLGYIPLKETFLNKNEEEAKAWKTPLDETGEEQFLNAAMDLLCKLKGVTYERTLTTLTSSEKERAKRVYTFKFEEEIMPDKLVLSFDQSSRLNCAEDFVLEVFDKSGNKTHTIEVKDNSVNYLGFSLDDVKAATVVLTVSSTYRGSEVIDGKPSLHAMNYTPIEQ